MAYLFEQKILNLIYDEVNKALRVNGIDTEAYYLFDTSSSPQYIGINSNADAATSASDWIIYQITGSSSVRKKTGSWDNRASLF